MNQYLPTLLSFLIILPAAAMCLLPMRHQLRYPLRRIILFGVLLLAVSVPPGAWLVCRFSLDMNVVLFPLLIIFYFFYHRSLRVPFCKSLAVYAAVCCTMGEISNLTEGLLAMRFPALGANVYTLYGALLSFGLSALTLLLMYYPLWKFGSYLVDNLQIPRVWYMTVPATLILLTLNVVIRPINYRTLYTGRIFMAYWFVVSLSFLLQILLFVSYYFIVAGILEFTKIQDRNRILEMQESMYLAQQKYMEESAAARHDFKQTIRTLDGLFQARDTDALEAYFEKYRKTVPENDVISYCKNNALNALLNYYAQLADRSGIAVTFRIDLPALPVVSDPDLCSMVGNILDNAVTACTEMEEGQRWIVLSATVMHGTQFCIVAANSFNGRVKLQDGRYLSTRLNGSGLGLDSIRTTAERCGGSADFSHEDREFYSNIMIPLGQRP